MPRMIDADELTHYLAVNDDGKQIFYVKSKDIDNAPTIDPVHAAGGCYCGECGYLGNMHEEDGETSTFYCHCWGDLIYKDDFCSRGRRREENDTI